MPAAVAFGRRWQIGTDDFVLPGLLDCTIKTCWLIAAIIIFLQHDSHDLCENGYFMKIYFYFMITTLTLTILTDISIVNKSMSGHMMDTEVRKLVIPLVYVRLFWEFCDININIVGTVWAYGETLRCVAIVAPRELAFIKRFIICNWMSVISFSLFVAYLFDSLGREHLSDKKSPDDPVLYEPPETPRSLFWEKRCKMYCCLSCDSSSRDDKIKLDGFQEVGKLLGNLVQDYDLLPSDILAGLIALYRLSEEISKKTNAEKSLGTFGPKRTLEKSELVIATEPKYNEPKIIPTLDSHDDIVLLNHYFKYINGLNGWKGFLADNHNHNRKSFKSLWNRLMCCGCLKSYEGIPIEGDNCCYCSLAALKEAAHVENIPEKDLIYISFINDYYQVPFYLAVDHFTKSYVLTFRGTFSGKDVITDLTAWPIPTGIIGLPDTFMVHHGVLLTARNAKTKIETLGLLENMQSANPDYKLVITGQSLGAAVATVLGMMWRSEFPDLKVYAFSPPGGLLNLEASIWSATFTTSIVYGVDMIARISLIALNNFRTKVIEAIEDCRTPKYKLLLGYCSCCCGISSKIKFHSLEETRNADSYIEIEESVTPQKLSAKIPQSNVSICTMYLPGKILHITERNRSQIEIESKTQPRYKMRWVDRSEFLEIISSPRMYSDHWPYRMLSAFREYLRNESDAEPDEIDDLKGNDNKAFEPC